VMWLAALTAVVLIAMLWLGFYHAREINRQKIVTALDTAVDGIAGLARVVELTAQSTERVVGNIGAANPRTLRTALETGLVAFRQVPELSHLGLVLPAADAYGNLERASDGTIRMWLYGPGGVHAAQTLRLGPAGFVEDTVARKQMPAVPPLYQPALPVLPDGLWNLRQHPWMVHDTPGDFPWGVSYTKVLHDDAGQMLGILDANFDLTQVYAYVNALRTSFGIKLDMIVLSDPPVVITDGTRAPQAVPAQLLPLLHLPNNAFADVMDIDGVRHWVAARSVTFHGGVSVLFVATRPQSLWTALDSSMLWTMGVLALLIVGVATFAIQGLGRHLGRTQSGATDADLEYLATHDSLTGLANQNLMHARLLTAIEQAQASAGQVALLYLDIDRFKTINEHHGYLFGNAVLKATGEAIERLVQAADTVVHFGADQFLILLTNPADTHAVQQLAESVAHTLKHDFVVEGRAVPLAVSIGIAVFPQHGETPDALIRHADLAMRASKEEGLIQVFSDEMAQQSNQRLELEAGLRAALEDGQLHLVYQPKVSLKTGKITGCEVLLRWHHPERGEIPPTHFIPVAEESGLILPIGDWVLETACVQARDWLGAGLAPVCVAVNLSAEQFFRRDVVAWVKATLQRTGLPPECLQLEFTESLHPQDMDTTIATFERLRSLGVLLALDDFGTGYSNLSYLKRFPVQIMKIDQSFVRHAVSSPQDAAIVRTVIALAHRLNITVLAEGVETEEQLMFLRQEQCDEIQGFYFSLPLAPADYAQRLRNGDILQ